MSTATLVHLTTALLEEIASCCSHHDVVALACTSRLLAPLARSTAVYRHLAAHDFLLHDAAAAQRAMNRIRQAERYCSTLGEAQNQQPYLPDAESGADDLTSAAQVDWQRVYQSHMRAYGPFLSCYRRVASVWQRLEAWYASHAPAIAATLLPGLTLAALRQRQSVHPQPMSNLPLEMQLSLLFHDGQAETSNDADEHAKIWCGMFGGYCVYNLATHWHLLPSQKCALLHQDITRRQMTDELQITVNTVGPPALNFWLHLSTGRIVRHLRDATLHVVSPSFIEWLETLLSHLESGQHKLIRAPEQPPHDVPAGLLRFLLPDPCGSDTSTRGIRIQVSVLYIPEASAASTARHLFTYHIRVWIDAEASERAEAEALSIDAAAPGGAARLAATRPVRRCKLTQRHWEISTEGSDAAPETVTGPGVIGLFPELRANATGPPFSYESQTTVDTPSGRGSMRGWFEFEEHGTGEIVRAMIDPFRMDPAQNAV